MPTIKMLSTYDSLQNRTVFMSTLRASILAGLTLLAWSAQAADNRPWQEIRQEVTSRLDKAQDFAVELNQKSQMMELLLKELQEKADQIHAQIGDMARRIERGQPQVDEMTGTLRSLHARQESTVAHRNETTTKLNQEQAAVQALFEGYARCVRDAWIFNFFCGLPPAEQESVQVRMRQMTEWERLIDDDSRSIDDLNQQIVNQYARTLEESFALRDAKAELERMTHEMQATAKETSRIRSGWLCITPKIQDIRSRVAQIEELAAEEIRPFIRAALDSLAALESDIQALQRPASSPSETCSAA